VLGSPAQIVLAGSFSQTIGRDIPGSEDVLTLLPFPENTPLPILLAAGISAARGDIVALTDIDTEPDSDWVTSILKEHESDDVVIGGVVDVWSCQTLTNWASYFCDYGQFMPPVTTGISNALAGNNISFKRSALPPNSKLKEVGFWKTLWCQSLASRGICLKLNSNIRVSSAKATGLVQLVARRFENGRSFAVMRAAEIGFWRRLIFALGTPVLPFVLLKRTFAAVMPKRRHRRELFASTPLMTLAFAAWSAGELVGGVAGKGSRKSKL
jgi:hypothetical protein